MEEFKDLISEDEIRVIGYPPKDEEPTEQTAPSGNYLSKRWQKGYLKYILISAVAIVAIAILALSIALNNKEEEEPALFEVVEESVIE